MTGAIQALPDLGRLYSICDRSGHTLSQIEVGITMRAPSECDGQIVYELDEFCRDHGDPAGQLFMFEITCNATTYVYANVAGQVRGGKVVFDLNCEDLVSTRKSH